MKKITLADPKAEVIKFLVRGQRGSNTAVELVIDAKGVIAQDADAVVAKERLGGNVNVSDVDAKSAVAELTADATAAEEARRAALTDEERAAEDEAKIKAEADAKAATKAAKDAEKAAKAAAKKKAK